LLFVVVTEGVVLLVVLPARRRLLLFPMLCCAQFSRATRYDIISAVMFASLLPF